MLLLACVVAQCGRGIGFGFDVCFICRELSFKKGDFLDLTGTVDENWLEGSIGGKEGIFPSNYVKVRGWGMRGWSMKVRGWGMRGWSMKVRGWSMKVRGWGMRGWSMKVRGWGMRGWSMQLRLDLVKMIGRIQHACSRTSV